MINNGRMAVSVATRMEKPLPTGTVIGGFFSLFVLAYLAFTFASVLGGMAAARGDPAEREKVARKFTLRVSVGASLWAADLALHEFLLGRSLSRQFGAFGPWLFTFLAIFVFFLWHRWQIITRWLDLLLDRRFPSGR